MSENKFDDLMRQKLQADEGADIPFDGAVWDKLAKELPAAQVPFWQKFSWKWGLGVAVASVFLLQGWLSLELYQKVENQSEVISGLQEKITLQATKGETRTVDTVYVVVDNNEKTAVLNSNTNLASFISTKKQRAQRQNTVLKKPTGVSSSRFTQKSRVEGESEYRGQESLAKVSLSAKNTEHSSTTNNTSKSTDLQTIRSESERENNITLNIGEENETGTAGVRSVITKPHFPLTGSLFSLEALMRKPGASFVLLEKKETQTLATALKAKQKKTKSASRVKFSELLRGVNFQVGAAYHQGWARSEDWWESGSVRQTALHLGAELSPHFTLRSGIRLFNFTLGFDDFYVEDYDDFIDFPGPLPLEDEEYPAEMEVHQQQVLIPLHIEFSPFAKSRIRPYIGAGIAGGWKLSETYFYTFQWEIGNDEHAYYTEEVADKDPSGFGWRWTEASLGVRAHWGKKRRVLTSLDFTGFTSLQPSGYEENLLTGYRIGAQLAWRLKD